jgi:hypothetical protein
MAWNVPVQPQAEVGQAGVSRDRGHHQDRALLALPEHAAKAERSADKSAVHGPGEALDEVPSALCQILLAGVHHLGRLSARVQHHLQVRRPSLAGVEGAAH